MMKINIREMSVRAVRSKYLITFLMGFVLYMLIQLPELISHNGVLLLMSDYDMQSIPFYYHITDMVKNGSWGWDVSTGYGSSFIPSYSFYNLFSPFTLLYYLVPRDIIIYAIPYISAVKMGVGSMLGFAYIKRFTLNPNIAVAGGLVYMFSSFTAYNSVFHFMDVIALFPILLISLEELCVKRRRGFFTFSVCLMLLVNYYFFIGQIAFVVIYYFLRLTDKENGFKFKSFISVALESVLGVLIAAIVFMPVVYAIVGSEKATTLIEINQWFVYDIPWRYLKLLQSFFTVPDAFQFSTLAADTENVYPFGGIGASIAGFIPLFSVAAVINFIVAKKKHWASILTLVCFICIFIPVLNSMFSAFNSYYYARWLYMPILIMAMMSVKSLEDTECKIRYGVITCSVAITAMLTYALLFDEFYWIEKTGRSMYNEFHIYINLAISAICLLLYIIITKCKRDKEFTAKLMIFTVISIYISYSFIFYIYSSYIYKKDEVIEEFNFGSEISDNLILEDGQRVLAGTESINLNQIWGYNALGEFNSIYDNGSVKFYNSIEQRDTTDVIRFVKYNEEELASFSSSKYYYIIGKDISDQMKSAVYIDTVHGYSLYENTAYIPMGYTYDNCITVDEFMKLSAIEKKRALIKAIVLENPDEFSSILNNVRSSDMDLSDEYAFISDAKERAAESAHNFKWGSNGFCCDIDLSDENLVFFSISRNDGFTAFVDGEEADIINANIGFMAVRVPRGTHQIEFKYTIPGFKAGAAVSVFGVAALTAYLLIVKKLSKKEE